MLVEAYEHGCDATEVRFRVLWNDGELPASAGQLLPREVLAHLDPDDAALYRGAAAKNFWPDHFLGDDDEDGPEHDYDHEDWWVFAKRNFGRY